MQSNFIGVFQRGAFFHNPIILFRHQFEEHGGAVFKSRGING